MAKRTKYRKPVVPDAKIYELITKGHTYSQIIAKLGVSSSRIAMLKQKKVEEKRRAKEEALVMIKQLEEEAKRKGWLDVDRARYSG